jgi:hypothetical protein
VNQISGRSKEQHDVPPPAASEAASDLRTALAPARERGRARVADILSRPDMLSADRFAKLLGTSRVTVNAKRQRHEVLGLDGAKRGFRFPKWQIGDDGNHFLRCPGFSIFWAVVRGRYIASSFSTILRSRASPAETSYPAKGLLRRSRPRKACCERPANGWVVPDGCIRRGGS